MKSFIVEVLKLLLPEPFDDFPTEVQNKFARKCLTDFLPKFVRRTKMKIIG